MAKITALINGESGLDSRTKINTAIASVEINSTLSGDGNVGTPLAVVTDFSDDTFKISDDGDSTKKAAFQASGITASTTRTLTVQDKDITIADEADHIRVDGSRAFTGDQSMGTKKITGLATPTSGTDAASKGYVDNLVEGLKWKNSVVVATTADITLSGEQTIDGVLTSASRILVKDNSPATENGIYITDASAWTRSTDADSGAELVSAAVNVEQGTANKDTMFVCTNDAITIGVTNIAFVTLGSTINHNNTTGLQGGTSSEYYHITSAQHTDLTDAGDSSLHYHSTDRARANHTGTQALSTISDVTATAAEVNYTDGVTSAIQTQIDSKSDKDKTINTQTGTTYTLALVDSDAIVEMNNASANTVTIPTNASVAFPTGTVIMVAQYGAGITTVEGDTGVTVNGVSEGTQISTAQYDELSLYKRGTNEWIAVIDATGGGGSPTWTAKTANYTAVKDDNLLADTSGGAFTITLPASPSAGDQIQIALSADPDATDTLTVDSNSLKIRGTVQDAVYTDYVPLLTFVYTGSTYGWTL